MIRATTPKHVFTFETNPDLYKKILITYAQGDSIVMEKTKDDLTIEPVTNAFGDLVGYSAWFRLSQEDTKKFQAGGGKQVFVQVRVLTYADEAFASDKKSFSVQDVLNDEVL